MKPGENIKALRLMLDMTQSDLAKRSKIPVGTIRDYETCRQHIIPPDDLQAISGVLNYNPALLENPNGLDDNAASDYGIDSMAKRLADTCGLDARSAKTAMSVMRIVTDPDPMDPGKTCYVRPVLTCLRDQKKALSDLRYLALFENLYRPANKTLAAELASESFQHANTAAADLQGVSEYDSQERERLALLAKYYVMHTVAALHARPSSVIEREIKAELGLI